MTQFAAIDVHDDRMKAEDAAAFLGISTVLLYRMSRARRVPHYRIGRLFRYSRRALEAFMTAYGTSAAA